ncbi:hypothetical protein B0H19DRAFT_1081414 [Mycena capillaripes]|nr:hypothetical protein B0H19DRAFT_1081144 [Mycena capillaripes]KAJ6533258.1 hypothetical protein B0H19DRAFT_1081414 [Mycena capillaripes]
MRQHSYLTHKIQLAIGDAGEMETNAALLQHVRQGCHTKKLASNTCDPEIYSFDAMPTGAEPQVQGWPPPPIIPSPVLGEMTSPHSEQRWSGDKEELNRRSQQIPPFDGRPSVSSSWDTPDESPGWVKSLVDTYLLSVSSTMVFCTFCGALSAQMLSVVISDGTIQDIAAFFFLRFISYVAILFNGTTALISLFLINRLGDVDIDYLKEGEWCMNGPVARGGKDFVKLGAQI